MYAVFSKLLEEAAHGRDTVLATIITATGSAPRGTGAQLLAGSEGLLCGTIGGGRMELLAVEYCGELLRERRSAAREFALYHGAENDIGAVCGGSVTVLFRYISAKDNAWQAAARDILERIDLRQHGVLLLPPAGAPFLADSGTPPEGGAALPLPIGERALLFGAGHCSLALSPLLQTVGFRVTVMDDRPALADPARFPGADRVICGDFHRIGEHLRVSGDDYVVIMTSGHVFDFTVQSQILRGPFAYVGVIGSRKKTAVVNQMLLEAGISPEAIAAVHTPIGTPIKAVTPEEIAVSIAGEMIRERAMRRERTGQCRRSCPVD